MSKQGQEERVRLNKFISDRGYCSRRQADRLIEAGKVYVDGEVATLGMQISPRQEVRVGKRILSARPEKIVLAVHKPVGIVCTEEKREKNNIIRFLQYPIRVTYIGRLDKDSRGLLLMTNDGDIVNRIMRSINGHEKEYKVTVDKEVTEAFLENMRRGVPILHTVTKPCRVEKIGKYTFSIVLTQGLNRQIRRMCQALGYQVRDLLRVRIMHITLGDLKPGEVRKLSDEEMEELYESIQESKG